MTKMTGWQGYSQIDRQNNILLMKIFIKTTRGLNSLAEIGHTWKLRKRLVGNYVLVRHRAPTDT